jgi:hypothetical protein
VVVQSVTLEDGDTASWIVTEVLPEVAACLRNDMLKHQM